MKMTPSHKGLGAVGMGSFAVTTKFSDINALSDDGSFMTLVP